MAIVSIEREPILTARTYEPYFDRREYSKKDIKDKTQLDRYTTRQVETLLGERLNVILSKNKYAIKNNAIYGENMSEPFIDVMVRGRDYRREIGGEDRIDGKREQAEIDGFSKIQDILCNPNIPTGTMMISVSSPGKEGSLYKHNFYDIFTLKKEKEERFIEARRYSSALSNEEYREKLASFYPNIYREDISPTEDYFLSHPVVISGSSFGNTEGVHVYLHKNHKYMEEGNFEQVLRACSPFIKSYIRALSENPTDVDSHSLILDAILNKVDREADYLRIHKVDLHDIFVRPYDVLSLQREIEFLGHQPVRQVTTGCGSSGGFGKSKNSSGLADAMLKNPFSVSDFAFKDDLGDREFDCPVCKYKNVRPYNEMISRCQNKECPNPTKVAC